MPKERSAIPAKARPVPQMNPTMWVSEKDGASSPMKGAATSQLSSREMTPRRKDQMAMTRDLAAKTRVRRGTAARVERICPEEYSPVMTSAPRTATTISPKVVPVMSPPAAESLMPSVLA